MSKQLLRLLPGFGMAGLASRLAVVLLAVAATASTNASPVGKAQDHIGFPYLSMQLAVDPCLQAAPEWSRNNEALGLIEEAAKAWPAGLCDDIALSARLRDLLYARRVAVARSQDPFAVVALYQATDKQLGECTTLDCLRKLLPSLAQAFQELRNAAPAHDENRRPDFMLNGEPLANPGAWLLRHAGLLADKDEWCGADARDIEVVQRVLRAGRPPVVVASCWTGGPEFPVWVLEQGAQGWTLLLALEGGSNTFLLATTSSQGYPDLQNSQRISAGEHNVQVLRHGVSGYCEAIAYMVSGDGLEMLAFDDPFETEDCVIKEETR